MFLVNWLFVWIALEFSNILFHFSNDNGSTGHSLFDTWLQWTGINLLCGAMVRSADLGMSFIKVLLLSFLRVLVRSFPPIQVQHVGSKLSAIFIKTECKNAWPLVNENALFATAMSLY